MRILRRNPVNDTNTCVVVNHTGIFVSGVPRCTFRPQERAMAYILSQVAWGMSRFF